MTTEMSPTPPADAALADAIQQGLYDWQMSRAPGSGLAEHIARTVAAHLLSDAVVERATNTLITAAARQIGDAADSDTVGRIRQRAMRAALQAAIGATDGG